MTEFMLGFNDAHAMKVFGYMMGISMYVIGMMLVIGIPVALVVIGTVILEKIYGK